MWGFFVLVSFFCVCGVFLGLFLVFSGGFFVDFFFFFLFKVFGVFFFFVEGGWIVRLTFIHGAISNSPISVCRVLKGCMLSLEHLQISFLTYWCS